MPILICTINVYRISATGRKENNVTLKGALFMQHIEIHINSIYMAFGV